MIACMNNQPKAIELLINKNVNINITDNNGFTAIDYVNGLLNYKN